MRPVVGFVRLSLGSSDAKMPNKIPPGPIPFDQNLAAAKALIAKERPDLATGASIEPMGLLGRLTQPTAQGLTNPLTGSVYISGPMNEGQSTQQLADVVLHELVHRKQVLDKTPLQRAGKFFNDLLPSGEPYHRRPDEMAAYEAEIRRAVGQGRADYTPSFATGQTIEQADIPLRRKTLLQQMKK